MSIDEEITTKEQWYDLKKYKDEIQSFVKKKRQDLDCLSTLETNYNRLYKTVFAGGTESDVERFPHAAEMFKTYKSAIIESSLSGYSALLQIDGNDAYSTLKAPQLKNVMTRQFKGMSLLENLSGETADDWILKGEAIAFIKLKDRTEQFRTKETLTDSETGEEIMTFKMIQGVKSQNLDIEYIDPLDFFVDGYDYLKDPIGCAKIIRSFINTKTLLTSDAYPLLSDSDKENIIAGIGRNGRGYAGYYQNMFNISGTNSTYAKTDKDQIEVLTFNGDYITSDNKVLCNINAVLVGNCIASLRYNTVSTNRIIYAPYKLDRTTHRSISPLASTTPINRLVNRVTDLFIKNLDDVCNPWMLYQKGTMNANQVKEARKKREIEYNASESKPEFWSPPPAAANGIQLMQMILEQNKNVLGLNKYMSGDTSGSVRTAEESAILFQKANARMRVETDVFSYRFMLNLFNEFYNFNRELALAMENPLDDIYSDPQLNVTISTNASRSDKEGELQRLMQMLNLPISQMIFSNLQPDQVILAVRYLMAKADLDDADNLLELFDSVTGQPNTYVTDEQMQQNQMMQLPSTQMQEPTQEL